MRVFVLVALLAACREVPPTPDAKVRMDAAADGPFSKANDCAIVFGSSLTNAFGRLDGTVRAVVPPGHRSCPMRNGTHLVVQIMMGGQAYRMVVNVLSDSGDPRVYMHEVRAPLAGPAWSEGWHPGVSLDYVTTLNVASTQFVPHDMATTVDMITDAIELQTPISVFGTSSGGLNSASAHLVHKHLPNKDGAIVIDPMSPSPRYLLIKFDEQIF
ncbi:MAG: hypothetical protein H0T46_13360 [Deltaproteobacteria bacterium]|nr:hypothetical protein [Deltaproteobacteria bacterium]